MGLIIGQGTKSGGGGGASAAEKALAFLYNAAAGANVTDIVVDLGEYPIKRDIETTTMFPNLKKATIKSPSVDYAYFTINTCEEYVFPKTTYLTMRGPYTYTFGSRTNADTKLKRIEFPMLETAEFQMSDCCLLAKLDALEELLLPKLSTIKEDFVNSGLIGYNHPNLRKLVLGTIKSSTKIFAGNSSLGTNPNLVHIELGEGTNGDLTSFRYGGFTNVTLTDTNELVEDKEAHPNWTNLDQWLYNFEHYIVDRLADLRGQTAKTITLQASCYNAIPAELRQKLSAKNWNLASA